MSEIEHVAEAIRQSEDYWWNREDEPEDGLAETLARVAIKALDAYRAEEKRKNCKHMNAMGSSGTGNARSRWSCPDCGASYDSAALVSGVKGS
jgi:transposase-like protein